VRFYERKEIKDALAYLRLLINPHDDVSFRRVVNVPARGVGKSVLDALENVEPELDHTDEMPLLSAGLQPAPTRRSLWARTLVSLDRKVLPGRALAALKIFRDLIVSIAEDAKAASVSTTLGKVLDRSGYLQDLRDERSEEAEGRLENLQELV